MAWAVEVRRSVVGLERARKPSVAKRMYPAVMTNANTNNWSAGSMNTRMARWNPAATTSANVRSRGDQSARARNPSRTKVATESATITCGVRAKSGKDNNPWPSWAASCEPDRKSEASLPITDHPSSIEIWTWNSRAGQTSTSSRTPCRRASIDHLAAASARVIKKTANASRYRWLLKVWWSKTNTEPIDAVRAEPATLNRHPNPNITADTAHTTKMTLTNGVLALSHSTRGTTSASTCPRLTNSGAPTKARSRAAAPKTIRETAIGPDGPRVASKPRIPPTTHTSKYRVPNWRLRFAPNEPLESSCTGGVARPRGSRRLPVLE